MFEVDESLSADIIGGHIFVSDFNIQSSSGEGVSWYVDVNGLVPYDGFLFLSGNNFSSVLLSSSVGSKFKVNVVFHLADDIVAFVEEAAGDVNAEG